jgi:hypothetical protein
MANREGHHEITSRWQHFPVGYEADAELPQHREDVRISRIRNWLSKVIEHWHKSFSAQPGEEFRTDESVHEQHFLASLPRDDWRVPYGIDGPLARDLVSEIDWRCKHGLSLDGLMWPPSDDPYAPANDPNHPYYLPNGSEA